MSQLRLIGLLLFITGVVLGLAAAATRTTHINVSDLWLGNPPADVNQLQPQQYDPSAVATPVAAPTDDFTSVPVAWPLLALSGLGLCFWFWFSQPPPPAQRGKSPRKTRKGYVYKKHPPRR